ncbi:MAG TPA: DUF1761 domain-containing protein [Anaerolineales bacterium]|jgi:hypothetical protein
MDFGSINWLAVVACVVVSMISGSLWYNPKTFFPIWWKGIGKKDDDRPGAGMNMGMVWGLTILASFVQAVAMAFMVKAMGSLMSGGVSLASGALTGWMLWLGFIAPTYLVNKLFAGYSLKIWAIEAGNHLLNFVLFGAILGAWH